MRLENTWIGNFSPPPLGLVSVLRFAQAPSWAKIGEWALITRYSPSGEETQIGVYRICAVNDDNSLSLRNEG